MRKVRMLSPYVGSISNGSNADKSTVFNLDYYRYYDTIDESGKCQHQTFVKVCEWQDRAQFSEYSDFLN